MHAFWLIFEDGSAACCEGSTAYDAKNIAQHLTGKKVELLPVTADSGVRYNVQRLPHPCHPCIWQHDHPVTGKQPLRCVSPSVCAGDLYCRRRPYCDK